MTVATMQQNQNMIMLSYRKDFWDSDTASDQSQWALVRPDGTIASSTPDLKWLDQKNILVVVHGFNTEESDILPAYFNVKKQMSARVMQAAKPFYDAVIGITWPGYQNDLEYYSTEDHARALASRLRSDINRLAGLAGKVDVIAHSTGNRFIFEALKTGGRDKPVRNLFSFAPVVDDESIKKKHQYVPSVRSCERVYIFHSLEDDVLKFLYPLVSFDAGSEDGKAILCNVQSIDCRDVVNVHSEYALSAQIYEFIRKGLQGELPTPPEVVDMKILRDGSIQIIHRNSWWNRFGKTAAVGALAIAGLAKFTKVKP